MSYVYSLYSCMFLFEYHISILSSQGKGEEDREMQMVEVLVRVAPELEYQYIVS